MEAWSLVAKEVIALVKLGPYQRSVSIIGVGCTPFKPTKDVPELAGVTQQDMFSYACLSAMEDANVQPHDVQFFYHGCASPYTIGDAITPNMEFAEWLGMRGTGSTSHSEACCTGYVGLEEAVLAVASGSYDMVVTGGCEMSDTLPVQNAPSHVRREFDMQEFFPALDQIYENAYTRALLAPCGYIWDEWMNYYARENGLTPEQVDEVLNSIAYHGRRAAVAHPLGYYTKDYDEVAAEVGLPSGMDYLRSQYNPKMTDTLRVSGIETKCDGAAAALVCPTEIARQYVDNPVEVVAIGASCIDATNPQNEKVATEEAIRQAYEVSGFTPDDIDIFYTNDFFLNSQLLSAEAAGYLPKGEGWKYALEGRMAFDGDKPVNTNGGRANFGHAHAASGLADICEAVRQIRGVAGPTQVKKQPKTAMLRGFGGSQNVRAIILRAAE